MSLLLLPLGILLPTLCGFGLVRLLEGHTPVLWRYERWVVGFALGVVLTMYLTFLAETIGIVVFTRTGFLAVQIVLLAVLAGVMHQRKLPWKVESPKPGIPLLGSPEKPLLPSLGPVARRVFKTLVVVALILTVLKVLAGLVWLVAMPSYFDDVLSNWNMRGKLFYYSHRLLLNLEEGVSGGVGSYPPTVPLFKAWLAALRGTWSEQLINSIHAMWYGAVLSTVFCTLRRIVPRAWALLGVYMLLSLPLYVIHGFAAYADLFLSLHILLAVSFFFFGMQAADEAARCSYLRLAACATGLLVFTKNEALFLHILPLAMLIGIAFVVLLKRGTLDGRAVGRALLHYGVWLLAIGGPWLLFKVSNNLTFGNAKSIGGLDLAWQPGVLWSIWINTFFEGNWNLLPVLIVALLLLMRQRILRSPALLFVVFSCAVYLGQFPIYLLTGLSTEVLNQTGYARGLVQIAPVAVVGTVVVLFEVVKGWRSREM